MGIWTRRGRRSGVIAIAVLVALASAGAAYALQQLPAGGQVNSDAAAGIDPALSVGGDTPADADVVGGSVTAGQPDVPWAIFRQTTSGTGKDQIFVRSFANGAWTTRGTGTLGGASSAAPMFSGSLNFDQGVDGQAPAIDFAGTGRTVPWATWYEDTSGTGFGHDNIFASRFDATRGKWLFAGQGRGVSNVPSLNIHTDEDAENPSVAGGTVAADPTNPGPWITWQETSTQVAGLIHPDEIFVERPIGPGSTSCAGVTPGGTASAPIGGFCWQQTGIDRYGSLPLDPSLNVDPSRNGVEPEIAFSGNEDSVPWVVWYEKDTSATAGLRSNSMVFAAKGVTDAFGSADGQMHWQVVGAGAQGDLDTTGAHSFGSCAVDAASEEACSLNADPTMSAENPRVAAGTMTATGQSVPWVVFDELVGSQHQVFLSRLVGSGTAARFVIINGGQAISPANADASRPDITFSGNTPYLSWRVTDAGGAATETVGHVVNAANPTFVVDRSGIPIAPTAGADVREPISSGCTANPFSGDGAACQGGTLGTPFFMFASGTSPLSLFADAYQPDAPVTGVASGLSQTTATISGSINPQGARTTVSFQFGTTTAYGQSTPAQTTGPDNGADAFTADLKGLTAGTTFHYRTVASNDFGTQLGADQTFTTQPPATTPPPSPSPTVVTGKATVGPVTVSRATARVPMTCDGAPSCTVSLRLTVTETFRGRKLIGVSARSVKVTRRTVVVGRASGTIGAGRAVTVPVHLNRTGRRLLAARHRLTVRLIVRQSVSGKNVTIVSRKLTFRAPKRKR